MSDSVYPKYALRAKGENQLNLSDAEQIYLRDRLDNQLISSQISGIPQEIVQAVFRQTIRYNKCEDDLCGSRLVDLISTSSSPHYCNRQVKALVNQSILIARDGFYGRILSMNFNFAQWGKSPAENETLISDPEGFCAENSAAIAQLSSVINPEKPATAIDLEVPTDAIAVAPKISQHTETQSQAQAPHTLEHQQISGLQAAIQTLSGEVATLKTLLQDVLQDVLPNVLLAHTDKKVAEVVSEQTVQAVEPPFATQVGCEQDAHDPKVPAPQATTIPEDISPDTVSQRDDPVSEALATLERCKRDAHATHRHEHNEPVALKSEHKVDADKAHENNSVLSFPSALKPHEKNAICKALAAENIKDKSTCQLLLDDLSSRFSISDWQPIRSPIGYFKSLIRTYKQGTFDESYVEDFRSKQKAAETAQKEAQSTAERRAYLDKYNEAKNNYENLKMAAQGLGRSLRDIAKDRGWTALIEEMGFDLDIAVGV